MQRGAVLILSILLLLSTPLAFASSPPTPADAYADFVAHGRLEREYPKSVLHAIIDDATLNQYGDPLITSELRLAARRQLAGVRPTTLFEPPVAPGTTTPPGSLTATPPRGTTNGKPAKSGTAPTSQPILVAVVANGPDLGTLAAILSAIAIGAASLLVLTTRARRRRERR